MWVLECVPTASDALRMVVNEELRRRGGDESKGGEGAGLTCEVLTCMFFVCKTR